MKNLFPLLLIFLISVLQLNAAELKLPAIIGSNMVLQQQTQAPLWGWAEPNATVSVTASWLEAANITTANKDGKWKVKLSTPEAGGPYEIIISADTTYILNNVLIGEVWVCSGQSNMQMTFRGYNDQPINGSNDYIAHGHNNNIRLFTVQRKKSEKPLNDCIGQWSISNPNDVANFSAVAYSFGKYLQDILDIPVGLIHTSWGGTPAEAWTDVETLKKDFKEISLKDIGTKNENHRTPTVLFNGMINPILSYGIKGAIWYQGESNRNQPELYSRLFPGMINNWRERWEQGEFPFYFVQIAPYKYDEKMNSAFLREAQLKTMQTCPNTGMAVTMDIGDYDCIHPAEKITVGKRLAYWALAKDYGMEGLEYSGPVYKSMNVKESKAYLQFDYCPMGLSSFEKPLENFEIAGEDKVFYPAEAKINRKQVIVWSEKVPEPVAVRYGWKNYLVGNLFNTAGLPASSFRTDDWEE